LLSSAIATVDIGPGGRGWSRCGAEYQQSLPEPSARNYCYQ